MTCPTPAARCLLRIAWPVCRRKGRGATSTAKVSWKYCRSQQSQRLWGRSTIGSLEILDSGFSRYCSLQHLFVFGSCKLFLYFTFQVVTLQAVALLAFNGEGNVPKSFVELSESLAMSEEVLKRVLHSLSECGERCSHARSQTVKTDSSSFENRIDVS